MQAKLKLKFQTALKVLIVLIYLYMVFDLLKETILLRFLWLGQEPCKKFVSGKTIYLMTTDAKAFPN